MAIEHAILVSLAEKSASGYDLARRFDASIGHFWKASHQQIYKVLGRMESDKWVECCGAWSEEARLVLRTRFANCWTSSTTPLLSSVVRTQQSSIGRMSNLRRGLGARAPPKLTHNPSVACSLCLQVNSGAGMTVRTIIWRAFALAVVAFGLSTTAASASTRRSSRGR